MDVPAWSTEIVGALARVHAVLRRSVETILRVTSQPVAEVDRAGLADFTERFTRFLEVHHDGEEEIIFPAVTAAAARASIDGPAASVAAWRTQHQQLLARLTAVKSACVELRRGDAAAALRGAVLELREILLPHLDGEEATFDGALLAKLMPKEEAMAMTLAASKHGEKHGGPRGLMMFVHALSDDEQRAQFAELPWFVRKVLVKRVWERDFRLCLKFAHNPSIAL